MAKHKTKNLSGVALGMAILSWPLFGCDTGERMTDISAVELQGFQPCAEDSDCVFATNGCCDCANGGAEVAINKDLQVEFKNEFDCSDVVCTLSARIPECGSGSVSCVNNLCEYSLPE